MKDRKLTDTTWEDIRKVAAKVFIGMLILAAIATALAYLL